MLIQANELQALKSLQSLESLRTAKFSNGANNSNASLDATKAEQIRSMGTMAFQNLVIGAGRAFARTTETKTGAVIGDKNQDFKFSCSFELNGENLRLYVPWNVLACMVKHGTVNLGASTTLNPELAKEGKAVIWASHPSQEDITLADFESIMAVEKSENVKGTNAVATV